MNAQQLLAHAKSAYPQVEPPCPSFGTCGGCTLQDLAYADQLALKRAHLARALAPLGDLPAFELHGLRDPWRYRNRAEFTFGEAEGRMVLGYHAARSFWRLVDLDDCLLLPEEMTRVLEDVRALAAQTGLPAYYPKTHRGFFRYLLVRRSRATGQLLLGVVTTHDVGGTGEASGVRATMERLADAVIARHPDISSVYWGVNSRLADIAIPERLELLRGAAYLEDRVGPFILRLAPLSFLQPSHAQAERIYDSLERTVSRLASGVAWDLYCGIGVIALYLARSFRKVYGIDVEAHHLELASLNASLNGVTNVEFRAGPVETVLRDKRFWLAEAKPDVVVVDPPRAGLHPQALASILAARPRALAYLSCNAQSLVRDLGIIRSSFPRYRVTDVQAFDMFPQTSHLEALTILERQPA